VWFRNTWAWGREPEENKPSIKLHSENLAKSHHHSLGDRYFLLSPSPGVGPSGDDVDPTMLFTENDTNFELLYDGENPQPYVKDAFHRHIVDGEKDAVNPAQRGTKCAAWFPFNEAGGVPPGECAGTFRLLSFVYVRASAKGRSCPFPFQQEGGHLPGRRGV
jgi:hypothetical protein